MITFSLFKYLSRCRDHAARQCRTGDPRSQADRQELPEDLVLPRPHQLDPARLHLPDIQPGQCE